VPQINDMRNIDMRAILSLLALICITVPLFGKNQKKAGEAVPIGYELYSWREASGEWNFCILYTTSIGKTVKQVFDDKRTLRGFDQLKRKLDTLPEGARVSWLNRIPLSKGPKAKGSEGLGYPPSDVIQEIRHYAEGRNIKIVIHGASDGLP
jgi:hypothetical protein